MSYIIIFSDGSRLAVEAPNEDGARARAYRIERSLPIVSIEAC